MSVFDRIRAFFARGTEQENKREEESEKMVQKEANTAQAPEEKWRSLWKWDPNIMEKIQDLYQQKQAGKLTEDEHDVAYTNLFPKAAMQELAETGMVFARMSKSDALDPKLTLEGHPSMHDAAGKVIEAQAMDHPISFSTESQLLYLLGYGDTVSYLSTDSKALQEKGLVNETVWYRGMGVFREHNAYHLLISETRSLHDPQTMAHIMKAATPDVLYGKLDFDLAMMRQGDGIKSDQTVGYWLNRYGCDRTLKFWKDCAEAFEKYRAEDRTDPLGDLMKSVDQICSRYTIQNRQAENMVPGLLKGAKERQEQERNAPGSNDVTKGLDAMGKD